LPTDPSCFALVAPLFPDRAAELALLVTSSEPFRSLCEDYELAVNALRQLEMRNRPQDAGRMTEYRQLIADLERELSESLDAVVK
jgi:hypothetical protein